MQVHQIKPKHKRKSKKRIGRGGKRGTYSGKGIKGQKSRAGKKMEPIIRGLIKKYPKLKGITPATQKSRKKIETVVNLSLLEKKFESGEKITPQVLLKKKIMRKIKGRVPGVKILAEGELTKKLIIEDCQVSKGARGKIEKAGGTIK